MLRPKATLRFLPLMFVASVVSNTACGGSHPEQPILQQFFRAAGLHDDQTLAGFATITFDPQTDGQVTDFTIASVSEPTVTPLKIKDLNQAVNASLAADKEFTARKLAYQNANADALKRVLDAEQANKPVSRADVAVQTEWAKWRDETAASNKKISDARRELAAARPVPELSLVTPSGPPPDLTTADGHLETKTVTMDATVKAPNGTTSHRQLVATLERAVVKTAAGEKTGRWIITGIQPG